MSYSEYYEDLDPYYTANLGEEFCALRGRMLGLLSEENKLMEIVKLIGADILPEDQKLIIETAKLFRWAFSSKTPTTPSTPMCPWTSSCA